MSLYTEFTQNFESDLINLMIDIFSFLSEEENVKEEEESDI